MNILNLTPEYFRPEVRDGFYVNGMMKRAWAAQMQELVLFNTVCAKYGIRWFADCGTLLGAVRHRGFIPWDDDIDVCMLRDDYQKFKTIMYDEFPDGYVFMTDDSRKPAHRKWDNLTRILNTEYMREDAEWLDDHYQFPYPAGVDIFPMDFIPDDPDELAGYKDLCTLLYTAMNPAGGFENLPMEEQAGLISAIEQATGYSFDSGRDLREQLYTVGDAVFSMYHREECSQVVEMGWWLSAGGHQYQKDWYEGSSGMQFENLMVPVPTDVDGHLKQEYGPVYMDPNRSFPAHNYPFYDNWPQIQGGFHWTADVLTKI